MKLGEVVRVLSGAITWKTEGRKTAGFLVADIEGLVIREAEWRICNDTEDGFEKFVCVLDATGHCFWFLADSDAQLMVPAQDSTEA
jgi:hypothetical protein